MDLAHLTATDLPADLGYLHLVRLVGEGSCGRTFAAQSRGMGGLPRSVAVTVLPRGLLQDQQRWRDLQTEVSRAALLRHRGIVRTFSMAVEAGVPYLVSELVEGVSLKQLLERGGPLTARQGLDIGIQLISALAAAHEPRPGSGDIALPHGELRPSAVMLGADGVLKLRGFGLAKIQPSRPGLAAAGFAAPEALSGQHLSLGTDLFSLGGLLFFSLMGEPPFPVHRGASAGERIAAIVKGLRGGGVLGDVDRIVPGLGNALGRMLCLDPTLRFSVAAEAEAIFREVRGALPRSSRLREVITERFGEDFGDAQDGPADSPPGLLAAESSRDLGVPDPPPIPAPSREILAAPREGPILRPPGAVSVPTQESFRPPTPALEPPPSPEPSLSPGPAFSLASELSIDGDDETTDAVTPLDAGPEPALHNAVTAAETAPRATPISATWPSPSDVVPPTVEAAPVLELRGRAQESGRRSPLVRVLAVVVGVLALLVLGLVVAVNLRSGVSDPSDSPDTSETSADTVPPGGLPILMDSRSEGASDQLLDSETGAGGDGSAQDGSVEPDAEPEEPRDEISRGAPRERGDPDTSSDTRASESSEERVRRRREASERRRLREARENRGKVESESSGPVSLSIVHSPLRSARMGSSELLTVRMDAPRSAKVVLHSGPAGGPYKKTRLKAKSGGRWEGWVDFRGTSVGQDFHYWLVATHPRAASSATSGSRSSPYRVEIQ